MEWTPMQKKAVEAPISDILVTAAAGSGKTQVLTGRILNRIQSGGDISKLLVITFTNAAAAEMRSRISKKLTEAVKNEKDAKKRHRLERQLSMADTADISTLHSFCLKLLRSYFYKLDLDPAFSLVSNYDRKIMLSESLADTVSYFYDTNNADFLELVDLVCDSKNDNKIAEMISTLRSYALTDPYPSDWLDNVSKAYESASDQNEPFSDRLVKKATALLHDAEASLKKAVRIADEAEGLSPYSEKFSSELSCFTSFLESDITWDSLYTFFNSSPFKTAPTIRKECDEAAKTECKALRDAAKAIFDKKAAPLIDVPYSDALSDMLYMKKYVRVLTEAAKKSIELYTEKKQEKNTLDFDDLEHLVIRLLSVENGDGTYSPSETADEISALYDEIYVDEYQDINAVQETIIKLISSERRSRPNVFMVGDMKQSIYRFRHTDPEKIFGVKAKTYTDISLCTEKDKYIKIPLAQNFRSHPDIIKAVNSVFDILMTPQTGGIEYSGDERLSCGSTCYTKESPQPAASVKVLTVTDANAQKRRELEADYVAQRIKEIISSGMQIYDKDLSAYRDITYRDIAILMRMPRNRAGTFQAYLKKYSIPVLFDSEYNFFESKEIVILTSLLKIIDNPLQDIDLIAVMRSPLFNFNESELAELSLYGKPYFYRAVCEASSEKSPLGNKCFRLTSKLKRWRREASLSGVYDFISRLIAEEAYMSYVSSMPESELHVANVNLFLGFAKKSDSSSYKGLFNFLKYIDELYTSGGLDQEASDNSSINAVRIMSIHKSKGLEFPYVFLCDTDADFNKKDTAGSLFLDRDFGIGINAFYPDRHASTSPMVKLITSKITDSALSEEMRILYVALTRAREYLEVTGCIRLTKKNPEFIRPEQKGYLMPSEVYSASSYLDWLLLAVREGCSAVLSKVDASQNDNDETAEAELRSLKEVPFDDATDEILSYTYSEEKLFSVKNKYSVSELKKGFTFDDTPSPPPLFSFSSASLAKPEYLNSDKVFTSLQKGSIMHYVVEHFDFSNSDVFAQLSAMNLTEAERAAVDTSALTAFISSDIAKRIAKSNAVFREVPFTFSKRLSELDGCIQSDRTVLVQGIIDCYFIENEKIILLDYKTDKNITDAEAKRRYEKQLLLYSEALTKKYNLPVTEKYIYLFDSSRFIGL